MDDRQFWIEVYLLQIRQGVAHEQAASTASNAVLDLNKVLPAGQPK